MTDDATRKIWLAVRRAIMLVLCELEDVLKLERSIVPKKDRRKNKDN